MIIQENTIIHGDSLTVLRQMEPESVDAIITDPPYGINYVSQTGASIKNDKSPFIWFLYDAFRVLKSGEAGRGGLICFTRWDVEQTFIDAMKIAGFNVKSEVIWDKVYHGMGDTKAAFAPSHENIVFAVMKKVFMLLDKHLEEILLVFGTMVMILLIFYQVVMRRCFNSSIAWSEELARYIFIWQVWLAVPYTVTKGRHIRLEVLLDVVKPKGRFVLDMIFFLVSAFFFGYIGYLSIGIVGNVIKMGQLTPALMIPKWLCYLALPVGTILGSLRFLQYGYKRIIRFKKDPTDTRTIVVEGEEEV